ncbi:hypothetical protein GCM10022402_49310 [Salinactinospora qingdaonensis]|uniref:Uncharacterized protein n=1 Tax=Salinactinospora qingdaonensis TaxID=702744 RepID=A0ABP7GIU1_9ACTN
MVPTALGRYSILGKCGGALAKSMWKRSRENTFLRFSQNTLGVWFIVSLAAGSRCALHPTKTARGQGVTPPDRALTLFGRPYRGGDGDS